MRGVVGSILGMLESGATHIGVATDHIIDSFRNDLWAGYKTGDGVAPDLLAQFPILEDGLSALGIVVWPMEEFEADDALASAALAAADDAEQVLICTPDKDLAQCVVGDHVVQLDRRAGTVRNEDGVIEKFGVRPRSIPDFLALVGDSADGFPGLPGWGAKSSAAILFEYDHLEEVPQDPDEWRVPVRGAAKLGATLVEDQKLAMLFRDLATLRTSVPVQTSTDELRWTKPVAGFKQFVEQLGAPRLLERAEALTSIGG